RAADDVRPKSILGQMARKRNDEVAGQRRYAAVDHQVLIAGLKEARSVAEIGLDSGDLPKEHPARSKDDARRAGRTVEIDEACAASERDPQPRLDLPLGARVRRREQKNR